jgi:GNAT superfamily N-acetyltransferase
MNHAILIRKATLADMPVLLEFEQGVITAERPFDTTLHPGNIHYYDIAHMIAAEHIELLVAAINDQLAGCGYARIENAKPYLQHRVHAYLGFMYVLPHYRGQGINQQIIEALKQWALLKNVTELRLDVYYENTAAIKAYEKAGFVKHMIEMRLALQ